jgi:hypothetical protein
MSTIKERWNAKTPIFWKKFQRVGITIGSLGAILIAPPIGLSVVGGYLITAGSVIGVISQLTTEK